MPTYEYLCSVCGQVEEVRHSIKEDPYMACPICGCIMKRKIYGGGFIKFNGTGFYETDYKNKPKEKK